jgi:hypothetical protein
MKKFRILCIGKLSQLLLMSGAPKKFLYATSLTPFLIPAKRAHS